MKKKTVKPTYSPAHKKYLTKLRNTRIGISVGRWGVLILFIGLWELCTSIGVLDAFMYSSPSRMISQLKTLFTGGTIWNHMWVTLSETLWAFAISTVLGALLALLLYILPFTRKVLEPYLVILNSLPKIALGPLIIIWMGAGTKAIITMGILICIIVTTISLLNGYLETDVSKITLLKTMGANKWQIMQKLIIPSSLPNFIAVLKINLGMSWVGVIMGEYMVSKAGIGYLINYGSQVFKIDLVMSGIVILCLLSALMYGVVVALEYYVNKKRGYHK